MSKPRACTDIKTQHHVRGFLGLAGYYRRFIKYYASIAAPLSCLLQKDGFKWGTVEAAAFDALKHQLSHAPILGLPNFDDTFVVEADTSSKEKEAQVSYEFYQKMSSVVNRQRLLSTRCHKRVFIATPPNLLQSGIWEESVPYVVYYWLPHYQRLTVFLWSWTGFLSMPTLERYLPVLTLLRYLHINRQALLEPEIQNHPQNAGINGVGQMTEQNPFRGTKLFLHNSHGSMLNDDFVDIESTNEESANTVSKISKGSRFFRNSH
ncbi:ty3-gypsy retrotransposon protein [Tanacetum coccineum]